MLQIHTIAGRFADETENIVNIWLQENRNRYTVISVSLVVMPAYAQPYVFMIEFEVSESHQEDWPLAGRSGD
jgi:hypothetical protein